MNRSADWLHQALADLELAKISAEAGHHQWACFACHQAVEKALNVLYFPMCCPDSLPDGAPTDHHCCAERSLTASVVSKATTPFAMPVRLLTQSVMRWAEAGQVLAEVSA
jgi:hypothetical protein